MKSSSSSWKKQKKKKQQQQQHQAMPASTPDDDTAPQPPSLPPPPPNAPRPPPAECWRRAFDDPVPDARQFKAGMPGVLEAISLLPLAWRMGQYVAGEHKQGRDPIFDLNGFMLQPPNPGPYAGVPLGGIGGGCIGRGFRGDFRRWNLCPGKYGHGAVLADQFSVRVKREGSVFTQVLSVDDGRGSEALRSWAWGMHPRTATYHALYPRAWTVYEEAVPLLRVTCRQISPVLPHDYIESSLPAAVFVWTVENLGASAAEVSLMFTFQNGTGAPNDKAGGHENRPFVVHRERTPAVVGVQLHHQQAGIRQDDPLTFAMAADATRSGVKVTRCTQFGTTSLLGDGAAEVWRQFRAHGSLDEEAATATPPSTSRIRGHDRIVEDASGGGEGGMASKEKEAIAAAVCQQVTLPPHGSTELAFALAWDMPLVRFGGGLALPRRYTRFFGKEGGLTAGLLASHALRQYPAWEEAIEAWQHPVLEDASLPAFYKHMLFNELYFLTDGGTVWTESPDAPLTLDAAVQANAAQANATYQACDGDQRVVGRFLYLEGHEYLMYNTYDVHFYASFALVMLWPMLELSVQRDVAAAVMDEDLSERRLIARSEVRPRKTKGAVPHDLGCPSGEPWKEVNAYNLQDVNRWKDLGPKLVLQAHRDYVATGSRPFARSVWPVLQHVMEAALAAFDLDGDGLIENSGFPDQTYDIWTVEGPSAYTGGLWVAALTAMAALGEVVGDAGVSSGVDAVASYQALADRARAAYADHLWNGTYMNYDNSTNNHQDSIMADQMAGQWYARACGLAPVVDAAKARSSLTTVFDFNVQKFGDGCSGAVNGMRPDGQVDNTCMQSQEVWTGTTYSVAAAMLQESRWAALEAAQQADGRGRALQEEAEFLRHAAFETARGLYEAGWKRLGYWFATPEAWDSWGHYRSLGYMRPLCVWAMQWALTRMPGGEEVVGETEEENLAASGLLN